MEGMVASPQKGVLNHCFSLIACGTHIRNTAEIGPVTIAKIENKGRQNRRIIVAFAG
jgi:Ser-tRNA(Ala) deacylase AlaX